jgi:hypothetical protein
MSWKECGRRQSWPNFKVLSEKLPGATEENHENSQDSYPPGPPEYEAGVLTTRPRLSVQIISILPAWPMHFLYS